MVSTEYSMGVGGLELTDQEPVASCSIRGASLGLLPLGPTWSSSPAASSQFSLCSLSAHTFPSHATRGGRPASRRPSWPAQQTLYTRSTLQSRVEALWPLHDLSQVRR